MISANQQELQQKRVELEIKIKRLESQRLKTLMLLEDMERKSRKEGLSKYIVKDKEQLQSLAKYEAQEIYKAKAELEALIPKNESLENEQKVQQRIKVTIVFCLLLLLISFFSMIAAEYPPGIGLISGASSHSADYEKAILPEHNFTFNHSKITQALYNFFSGFDSSITGAVIVVSPSENSAENGTGREKQVEKQISVAPIFPAPPENNSDLKNQSEPEQKPGIPAEPVPENPPVLLPVILPENLSGNSSEDLSDNYYLFGPSPPQIRSVTLNSTNPANNNTYQNLTANVSYYDLVAHPVRLIYNWRVNNHSLTMLNMPFEKINSTTINNAYDYSGLMINITDNGSNANWSATAGYDGKGAYVFRNSFIKGYGLPTVDTNGSVTITMWLKPDAISTSASTTLFNKASISGCTNYGVYIATDFTVGMMSNNLSGTAFSTNTIAIGAWNHLVVIFNGSGTYAYINGSYSGALASYGATYCTISNFSIARYMPESSGGNFNGTIDELVIWNRSLSAQQINALYNNKTNIIVSEETARGENWSVDVTGNDADTEGNTNRSNVLTILNSRPVVSLVTLNSTNPATNNTNQNLTANVTYSDAEGDSVKLIYNWRLNGTSLTQLNMPFEKINGTNTSNAYDYSGYRVNITDESNVVWLANDGYNRTGAYNFSSTLSSYIKGNGLPTMNTNASMTITLWLRPSDISTTTSTVIFNKALTSVCANYGFGISVNKLIRASNQNASVVIGSGYTVNTGSWSFLALVYNSSGISVYLNNTLVGSSASAGTTYCTVSNFSIGRYMPGPSGNYYNGSIDEFIIWNRSLSAQQLNALYNNKTNIIVSEETVHGENWSVDVTPNDGYEDGIMNVSSNLTILNIRSAVSLVTLNSTNPATNDTNQNLTASVTYSDAEGDSVKLTYNWRVNGNSLTLLNMPFEKINGTDASNAYDYSGFGINATDYSCATWRGNGGYNRTGAYNFSGAPFASGCYISGNGLPIVDTNQSLTLTVWFNATANAGAGAGATVFEQGWSDCESYSLFISSAGAIGFLNNNGSSGFSLAPTIDANQWTHFALVMNRSGTYGYKNGAYVGDISLAQGTSYCPYSNWSIGVDSDAPGFMSSFFNGTIDELVIWNKSLSQQQIEALYHNKTNIIVYQETSPGENWSVDVIPNDGFEDGYINSSNNLTVLNTDISACKSSGWIAGETYYLAANLSSISGACMSFSTGNITLDCRGNFLISDGAGAATDYGINISNIDNITVRNCKIIGFYYNIYLNKASNSSILHCNSSASLGSGGGVYFLNSNKTTVFNTSFEFHNSYAATVSGPMWQSNITDSKFIGNISTLSISSMNFSILNNEFRDIDGSAILFSSPGSHNRIENNIFLNITGYVMQFNHIAVTNNKILNNQFNNTGSYVFYASANNYLRMNQTYYGNKVNGYPVHICFYNYSFNASNTFTNATYVTPFGSVLLFKCGNATFHNITVTNHVSTTGYGAVTLIYSDNVTFQYSNISEVASDYGIISFYKSYNLSILHSYFRNNNGYGISAGNYSVIYNNTFVNHPGTALVISHSGNVSYNNFSRNNYALSLSESNNSNVTDNYFSENNYSLQLSTSSKNEIRNNKFINNSLYDIYIGDNNAPSNVFLYNQFNGSAYNVYSSILSDNRINQTFHENFADGYPFYLCSFNNSFALSNYRINALNGAAFGAFGGMLMLYNCHNSSLNNITLVGNSSSGNSDGLDIFYSGNVTVARSNFTGNDVGAYLYYSENVTIKHSTFSNSTDGGLYLGSGNSYGLIYNNTFTDHNESAFGSLTIMGINNYWNISGNNFTSNYKGIYFTSSEAAAYNYLNVTRNTFSYNNYAIYSTMAAENHFFENVFVNNINYSFYGSETSNNNYLYRNNFKNSSTYHTSILGADNLNYSAEGNYWDTYDVPSEGCVDDNNDGFCDSPYYNASSPLSANDSWPYTHQFGFENNAPTINNLTNPANNSNVNITTLVLFKFNVSDDTAIKNCTLYANFSGTWAANITLFNVTIDVETTIAALYLPRSSYIWNVLCYDTSIYENYAWFSSNYTLVSGNSYPAISKVIVNSTDPATNDTNQNLTANVTSYDADEDSVKNIYNWLVNNKSIAVLNMPFERINNTGGVNGNAWDYSGYGNNGSEQNGVLWNATSGYDGKGAYDFDGINDYIDIATTDAIMPQELTISAWINPSAYNNLVLGLYEPVIEVGGNLNAQTGYYLGFYGWAEVFYFLVAQSGRTWSAPFVNNNQIPLNTFTHLVATWDSSGGKIYLNGTLAATSAYISPINYSSTDGSAIGCLGYAKGAQGHSFNGTIDDFRIYNRSLSAEQILALYNNRTDLIVANETVNGENWSVDVTPNDGYGDGQTVRSNTVLIRDIDAPTFSNPSNTSSNFRRYQNFTANITISNFDLDAYKFSSNANGSWFNLTRDISGATYYANESLNISWPVDTQVCWYYWANDSSNNAANSNTYCFNVVNTPPTQATPKLNSTNPATNDTNQNLTAYNQSTFDLDDKNVTNIYNWLVNNKSITVLNMPFEKINNTDTSNAWDYSGFGNNGTISDATWNSTGGYGGKGAYQFDGVNDYINLGTDIPALKPTIFSVEAWMYLNSETTTSFQGIVDGTNTASVQGYILVYTNAGNTFDFYIDQAANDWRVATSAAGAYLNAWHHLVGTFNGTILKIYLDGVLQPTTGTATQITYGGTGRPQIGRYTTTEYFNGTIDEVRIWNRSLSAEQVLALYNNRTDLIVSNETIHGENWSVDITPNDGYEDGQTLRSNPVTILNTKPTQTTPKLNSTNPATNDTNQNLTAYAQGTADIDNDSVKNIYNWQVNNQSIALLNMPFEQINTTGGVNGNAWDYSGYGNNGTIFGATWNSTGGYDGKGAYSFDGAGDYVSTNKIYQLASTDSFSWGAWIYPKPRGVSGGDTNGIVSTLSAYGSGGFVLFQNQLAEVNGNKTACIIFKNDTVLYNIYSNSPLTLNNQWYHVFCVYNGTTLSQYLNGALQSGTVDIPLSFNASLSAPAIGRYYTAVDSYYFNGSIDSVMIYNRSLSSEQILALYNNRTDLIVSNETTHGENWSVDITPNDGYEDGQTLRSNPVTILNTKPTQTTPKLNSTNPATNDTNQNLTAYAQGTADIDNDSVKNIYNWQVNNQSIALLNMPFEQINKTGGVNGNAWDYSGYGNNASESGSPVWNAIGGYDGKGAYQFDGINDFLQKPSFTAFPAAKTPRTMTFWIKLGNTNDYAGVVLPSSGSCGAGRVMTFGGKLELDFGNATACDGSITTTTTITNKSQWYHIATVYNTTHTQIYVNGTLENTATITLTPLASSPLVIGYLETYSYMNGTIDDLMIFNRSLSADQVLALYNNRTNLIVSNETAHGENWSVDITSNDGYEDGSTLRSNPVTILNTKPTQTTPKLNSTNPATNDTNQNLTAYARGTGDIDNDSVKSIYNWLVNNKSIAVLNMPFEQVNETGGVNSNAWDYSGYGNNGSKNGDPVWTATGGYDGKGAYQFDGLAGMGIRIPDDSTFEFLNNSFTLEAWVYPVGNTEQTTVIFEKKYGAGNKGFLVNRYGTTLYFYVNSDGSILSAFNFFTANAWNHVVITLDSSTWNISAYNNGIFINSVITAAWNVSNSQDLGIGYSPVFGWSFNGTIDEVRFWNSSLSAEQVLALYNNRTDLIVSQETENYENWSVDVTPNDGYEDGQTLRSNSVLIQFSNTLPLAPVLIYPEAGNITTNSTPGFTWNNSYDADSDILTYNLLIDDNPTFNNPEVNVSGISNTTKTNTTYDLTTELTVDTVYYWKVRANDSYGYGDYSAARNFTVQSYLAISLLDSTVSFGNVSGGTNTSTPGNATPFRAENAGNILANVTITASSYFQAVPMPSTFYQFKIRENESGAFNTTESTTSFTNMNGTAGPHVVNLNWQSSTDDFLADLGIYVPYNETPGLKSSTITFTVTG